MMKARISKQKLILAIFNYFSFDIYLFIILRSIDEDH